MDATLGSGISAQVAAVREGFNEVFDIATLGCFYEDELETLLCGSGEHWTVQVRIRDSRILSLYYSPV